jgi:hypothetical protein
MLLITIYARKFIKFTYYWILMLQSEMSKRQESSLPGTDSSSMSSESYEDNFSKIPLQSLYKEHELIKLKNFYEM